MTEDLKIKFPALIALRNTEATLRWTRSQLFIFINSGGLTLVVTQRQLGTLFLYIAGMFGLVLMICWMLATRRANQWLTFWHSQLAAAEDVIPPEITIFSGEAYKAMTRSPMTINRMLTVLMGMFTLLWIVVLTWSFF